jgi:hypothetical protein
VIVTAAVKGHGHARIVPDLILERDNARRLIRGQDFDFVAMAMMDGT